MKLDFVSIPVKPREINVSDFSWLPEADDIVISEPRALLTVVREGDKKVVVSGNLQFAVEVPCDRCGERFSSNIDADFTYFFKHGVDANLQEEEVELTEDDIDTVYLQEPYIDIHDLLLEQYYLGIPQSRLCRQDCPGVCHRCGALNTEHGCTCEPDISHSPFSVLAKLKK